MASSSSIIKKLSRNKTLITTLNSRILTHLPDPPLLNPIPIFNNIPKPNPNPNPNHNKFPVFYPTFAFESFLNPVNQTGYIEQEEGNDVVLGEEENVNVIYADSVKKKRKKKMNKHKLKKLRKRLRRKT